MESTNEVLQIKVDQSRLISNLNAVFSSNTKVIAELMQNARRAGATRIDISQSGDTVVIGDNGSGINSFEDVLTLARSGWDDEVMNNDAPYGMGFFSALFSAKKVIVRSNGRQIIVHCDQDLLDQKIDVLNSDVTTGTEVILSGCNIENLENILINYCRGFEVDVYLNDSKEPIPSPHRLNADFEDFDAGKIRAPLSLMSNPSYSECKSYIAHLQGFEVVSTYGYVSRRHNEDATVIHLDASFKARMPDRDCLINATDEQWRIQEALIRHRREQLLQVKSSNPLQLFAYYSSVEVLNFLEVFNDIDVLPKTFFGHISLPVKSSDYSHTDIRALKIVGQLEFFTKAQIAAGAFLSGDPTDVNNSEHPHAMALMMALHVAKSTILIRRLHENHWVYGLTKSIPDLSEEEYVNEASENNLVKISYPQPSKSGKWGACTVHLVDSYTIEIPSLEIKESVDSQLGLAIGCDDDAYDFSDPAILLMPKDSDADVLDQACNWISNDDYDDHWANEEKSSLNAYLRVLRGQNLSEVLADLLRDTDPIIRKALAGNVFQVQFKQDGIAVVSEGSSDAKANN